MCSTYCATVTKKETNRIDAAANGLTEPSNSDYVDSTSMYEPTPGLTQRHRDSSSCAEYGDHYSMPSVDFPPSMTEPLREPMTEDIPWNDLVFWLGDIVTGQVNFD